MATTTLNTRLRLKYDTLANWQKNNPVILAGEAAVVVVPAKSGAVFAEEGVDLTGFHLEVYVLVGVYAAEGLANPAQPDTYIVHIVYPQSSENR